MYIIVDLISFPLVYFKFTWAEGSQCELIVYQWSVASVRRRRPHFQTWMSQKPVGQSWSNFICSITGVGKVWFRAESDYSLWRYLPLNDEKFTLSNMNISEAS